MNLVAYFQLRGSSDSSKLHWEKLEKESDDF